jgi:hypothetical protein
LQRSVIRRRPAPLAGQVLATLATLVAGAVTANAQAPQPESSSEAPSVEVTNTMRYAYHFDNDKTKDNPSTAVDEALQDSYDDWYHHFLDVLDITAGTSKLRAGGRFDINWFGHTVYREPFYTAHCGGDLPPTWCNWQGRRYVDQFAAERLYLTASFESALVTLGDFNASFGKGLALHTIKTDQTGQDTTIRGLKLMVDWGPVVGTALGGRFNPLDSDEGSGWKTPWHADSVFGGELGLRLGDKVLMQGHGVVVQQALQTRYDGDASASNQHVVYGGVVDANGLLDGSVSLSAEVDVQERRGPDGSLLGPVTDRKGKRGWAGYTNATAQIGDLTFVAEAKNYDDFALYAARWSGDAPYQLAYHRPPDLERAGGELVKNNHSVRGARVRADWDMQALCGAPVVPFVSYAQFSSWNNGPAFDEKHSVYVPSAGLELEWQDGRGHLAVSAGRRREYNRTARRLEQQDDHLQMALEQIVDSHHLKLSGTLLRHEIQETATPVRWMEAEALAKYEWRSKIGISLSYQRQEDPRLTIVGSKDYYAVSLQYVFSSDNYVAVKVGSNKPGIECAGQGCREVPAFNGASVVWVSHLSGST